MTRRRKPWFVQPRSGDMTIDDALPIADAADLEDGAWMAMLCDLTGMDAGEVSAELAARPEGHARDVCPCDACVKFRKQ